MMANDFPGQFRSGPEVGGSNRNAAQFVPDVATDWGQKSALICLGSGWIDFDAALEMGSVFDADSSTGKVAGDGPVFRDFDPASSVNVADKLAIYHHFAGVDFRIELRRRADNKPMAVEGNWPFYDAVDLQVL